MSHSRVCYQNLNIPPCRCNFLHAGSHFSAQSYPVFLNNNLLSSLTVVLSPSRNRCLSPLSGDPQVFHINAGRCRISGKEKSRFTKEMQSSDLPSKPHLKKKGWNSRVKVPFLLSVSDIIIGINALCTHMTNPRCHRIHLNQNNRAYCGSDPE